VTVENNVFFPSLEQEIRANAYETRESP